MKQEMLRVNVIPMMLPKHTAVIGISTPGDEDDFYTQLRSKLDPQGRPYFRYISFGLICESCLRLNRECTHKNMTLPHFRSTANQEMAERLMGDADDAKRELAGVISNRTRDYCFRAFVDPFLRQSFYTLVHALDVVHIGIDPGGGGAASDYCMSSFGFEGGKFIALSIDRSNSSDHNEIWQMQREHLLRLRTHAMTRNAIFWVYFETNMGWIEAKRVQEMFSASEFGRVVFRSRDREGRPGVITTAPSKELMAKNLTQILSDGNLVRWRDFQTQIAPEKLWDEFAAQLRNYRREVKFSKEMSSVLPKVSYSGKHAGRDDMAMVTQITLHEARATRLDEAFIQLCHTNHWRF